ncbi:hypothetical protein [Rhodococcus sp. ACPA4]|nr:hypothetical protein [Rhodococcus sp. ACPA4]
MTNLLSVILQASVSLEKLKAAAALWIANFSYYPTEAEGET